MKTQEINLVQLEADLFLVEKKIADNFSFLSHVEVQYEAGEIDEEDYSLATKSYNDDWAMLVEKRKAIESILNLLNQAAQEYQKYLKNY